MDFASEQPPQRRDNGLRAEQFVALADVDPRLGEHLLDLLKLAEIPAYLEPSGDPLAAARYPVTGPIERLYVQADRRGAARAVVVAAAHEAGEPDDGRSGGSTGGAPAAPDGPAGRASQPDLLSGLDTDAEFARMMASFDSAAPAPPRPDHSAPAPPAATGPPTEPDQPTALDRIAINRDPIDAARLDAAADEFARRSREDARAAEPVEDDDHFQPPVAPPFPVPRLSTLGAMALFVLGLLVIARGDWFGLGSGSSFPLGVIAVLTAVVLLIRGLRDRPPEDADPDDGAVV